MKNKTYVISVGGSLINPGQVDVNFLKKLRALILREIKHNRRFIIVTGGGKLCRHYQAALKLIAGASREELDWMGIATTWYNAELVRLMFRGLAYSGVIKNPNRKIKFREKILVAGGWAPGRSSDDDAVRLGKIYGAETVINLTNIDYVYDKDPNKYPNAKIKLKMTWPEFRKIVGNKYFPGIHAPFDPVAAKEAQELGLEVVIMNGKNIKNMENYLDGNKFKGTVIK